MGIRRWTMAGSAVGLASAAVLWLGLVWVLPAQSADGVAERLAVACAALLPASLVLALMVACQMLLRSFTGAVDPLAGLDGTLLLINQRVTANTVEQLVGFAPALLALSAGMSPDAPRHIVAAGLVFAAARLAFWVGYLLSPLLRAPGMAATFAVNTATLAAALWVWRP